jgi:hypothetical protein
LAVLKLWKLIEGEGLDSGKSGTIGKMGFMKVGACESPTEMLQQPTLAVIPQMAALPQVWSLAKATQIGSRSLPKAPQSSAA